MVYIVGSAAGIKLLPARGPARALPWISLVISIAVLPFVGPLALAAVAAGAAGLVYSLFARRR